LLFQSYVGKYLPALAYHTYKYGNPSDVPLKGVAIGDGFSDPETVSRISRIPKTSEENTTVLSHYYHVCSIKILQSACSGKILLAINTKVFGDYYAFGCGQGMEHTALVHQAVAFTGMF
jgi:hypothetical protein